MKMNKDLQAKTNETPEKLSAVSEEKYEISDDKLDGVSGGVSASKPTLSHKIEFKPYKK